MDKQLEKDGFIITELCNKIQHANLLQDLLLHNYLDGNIPDTKGYHANYYTIQALVATINDQLSEAYDLADMLRDKI